MPKEVIKCCNLSRVSLADEPGLDFHKILLKEFFKKGFNFLFFFF